MELEHLYNTLIEIEDCEKKLAVLPTGTSLRTQVECDGKEGIKSLGVALIHESNLKRYIAVRKGKTLLIRALRWLDRGQMRVVMSTLLAHYPLAVRKDREDKLLPEFWNAGIRHHLTKSCPLGLLLQYLDLVVSSSKEATSKAGTLMRNILTTPLGMSMILALLQRIGGLIKDGGAVNAADKKTSRELFVALGAKMAEELSGPEKTKLSAPIEPVTTLDLASMNDIFTKSDLASDGHKQLQKLVTAGKKQPK